MYRLQIALIRFWLKHRRLTGLILWVCRRVYLTGPGGRIGISFSNYRDFKTFREVFFEEQYRLDVEPNSVKTIVDLGANMGYATAYFFLKYPNAKIISVEPIPQGAPSDQTRIIQKNVAIAGTNGTAELHVVDGASASASLMSRTGESGTTVVKTETLSTLLADIPEADILKIDIEGSEEYVLQDPAIRKAKHIIGEIHPDLISMPPEELIKNLSGFTHSLHEMAGGRLLLIAHRIDL